MQSRLYLTLFLLFAPLSNITAFAGEAKTPSQVVKVTVFPSGASIIRSAKIDLVAGDQTIVLQGLPERLIRRSLRVEGAGDKSFEIGSVDAKPVLVDMGKGALDKTERAQLEEQIERLGDESNLLTSRISAAQTQRRLMERLSTLPGQPMPQPFAAGPAPKGSAGGVMTVESWGKIFDLIGARMKIADDLILKYQQQRRKKQKEIAKLKKRLAQEPPKKDRQMEVRVAIHADEAMSGSLKIKYQVREASWRPFYDARLATGQKGTRPSLVLTRRAGIRQWSGEDWSNVKLSLSTTSPQRGAQAPVLHPKRLDIVRPYPVDKPKAAGYGRGLRSVMRPDVAQEMMAAPAPPVMALKKRRVARAVERKAVIRKYAFQAVFGIPGQITILSTGDEKKVAISRDVINAKLKIKTVPKLNSTAFLYAKFTHGKKQTPLLPGSVALYRDGIFAGNGAMPLVNAGDEHSLGFGADDAVKVTRAQIKRTKGEAGVFTSSKVDERRYVIKVTNLHETPVDVEVVDQIPYSVNEQVVVRLLPSSTKPGRQNIKDKRGILGWDFTLAPGKEKRINLDYTITWPADKELTR